MPDAETNTPVRGVFPRPEIGNGFWQHYKGGTYEVYGLSQRESTGEWEVLYRNARTGLTFHRPASEWNEDMKGVPRFRYLGATALAAIDCNRGQFW